MTRPMPTTSKSKKINSQSIIESPSAHSDRDQYSSSHCIHIDTDQNGQSDGASQAVIREHRGSRRAAEFSCRMRVPDGTKQVLSFCRELFQKILCPSFEGVGVMFSIANAAGVIGRPNTATTTSEFLSCDRLDKIDDCLSGLWASLIFSIQPSLSRKAASILSALTEARSAGCAFSTALKTMYERKSVIS